LESGNNNDITFDCVGVILKFVHYVIQLKNEDFIILYPIIITLILHWTQSLNIYKQVMSILQTIIINIRIYNSNIDQNLQYDIHEKLKETLNVSNIHCVYLKIE